VRIFFVAIDGGKLLWETKAKLTIDGAALVPREGEIVWLPGEARPHRVERIERYYGGDGYEQVGIFVA
jgi:hypothetical protein